MKAIRILATEIKVGDTIQSPHTSSYWGTVYGISETITRRTFYVNLIKGEMKGTSYCYTFFKTSKVKIDQSL